jgi:hypothetical protein
VSALNQAHLVSIDPEIGGKSLQQRPTLLRRSVVESPDVDGLVVQSRGGVDQV